MVNQHLLKDLTELGIWGEEMKHKLIAHHGSVQVNTTINDLSLTPFLNNLSLCMKHQYLTI